ncbi:MAG: amidase [Chloroflexota bacterium]
MTELIYSSVVNQAEQIRRKAISSVELTKAYLARIKAVNAKLNAVVQLAAETALKEATEADNALAQGNVTGPLHGIPMTIKDSFDTAGIISTWGTLGRKDTVPAQDATIVTRLKAAGAILLGKTNTPEFTLNFETNNGIYGRTNNPYNPDRSSGGSSGGAAALVASGGISFDIGTDTGGSIRLPAHCCGIAGLKPTSGRVPRTGHAVDAGSFFDSLTTVGPMARFVDDLSLLFPIIAGPDGRDPFIAPVPIKEPNTVDIKSLRAIFYTDNGIQTPIPEIMDVVQDVANKLAETGMPIEEKRPPGIEESFDLLVTVMRGWDGGANLRALLDKVPTSEDESWLEPADPNTAFSGIEMVDLIAQWDRFRMRMLSFMTDYDIIIAPVNAYTAIPHGTLADRYKGFSYTMTYNLTGWPGVVVRVGTANDGLPIGIQVIAKPWREEVSLAVAKHLETVFGGWQKPTL